MLRVNIMHVRVNDATLFDNAVYFYELESSLFLSVEV